MKHVRLLTLTVILGFLVTACSLDLSGGLSTVRITLGSMARYLSPDSVKLTLMGAGPNGATLSPKELQSGTNTISGLEPGDWTFTVQGSDSSGTVVQEGSIQVTLVNGNNDLTLTLGAPSSLTLTYGEPDPVNFQPTVVVDGGTVTLSEGVYRETPSDVQTLTIDVSSGFDSYRWYVDGLLQESSSSSWSNDGNDATTILANGSLHHVVVIVQSGEFFQSLEIQVQMMAMS